MAGGDIRINPKSAAGTSGALTALQAGAIDANTKQNKSFSEMRNIDGKDVWLTPAGAAAYDKLKGDNPDVLSFKVEKDPGWISDWFWSSKERAETIGKP